MAATKTAPWTVERLSEDAIRINLTGSGSGWKQRVLIQTDEHWDNAHCDRAMLKRHHEEAVECGAPILKFGDIFCAMQGKWDKRADQNQLRPEHRGNNYLDRLVDTAEEWYTPYAGSIAVMSAGNHETSIETRHQTDLLQRLAGKLRTAGSPVEIGPYCGFVRFAVNCAGKVQSKDLCYHHGYGGGGEVTRGMIDNNRTRGQYMADIYVSGHIHRRNMDENVMYGLSWKGTVERHEQVFLRSATYKDEGRAGWHVTQGRAARPLGGWWLEFSLRRPGKSNLLDINAWPAK